MRILEHFIESLRSAAKYNPDVQAAPHCILWTDADRQWEVIIPRLQDEMAELFVLGDYAPTLRRGPAIWLRCVLARPLTDVNLPSDVTPVFYLPGISRQDLRAVDTCPEPLKPLAELQYRGVIWSQVNAKDWTILAYLQSGQGGLSFDLATDKDTKTAMQLVLPNLIETDIVQFQQKRLDKDDFYRLISADPAGDLLKWLDDDVGYRTQKTSNEWQAFVELCRYQFAFNPETEGALVAAEKLANHLGPWAAIWQRYRDAALRYKHIVAQIQRVNPPSHTLDWRDPTGDIHAGWPQWNKFHEDELRHRLTPLLHQTPTDARATIAELEQQHSRRRDTIWAKMGLAPLAQALEHLKILATITAQTPLNGGTIDDLATGYQTNGWRADDAVMRALACVKDHADQQVVADALRAIYLPWAENSARYLQNIVNERGYPQPQYQKPYSAYGHGRCILFVDGLRFDVAQRLIDCLRKKHFDVAQDLTWAALPSVTATGKPAVSPVKDRITGSDTNADFEPEITESHKPANSYHFSKLLTESGWQLLKNNDTGNTDGKAWAERGIIDQAGHTGDLPQKLDTLIDDIGNYVERLFGAGWKQVDIVTDHGWLYMPGGLPKSNLPSVLTENQWGRCAALKAGASYEGRLYPWHWNSNQHFALADGVSCFRSNVLYAHGGLSLQECCAVNLTVTQGDKPEMMGHIAITEVDWREMRCDVFVTGGNASLSVDIREKPNDPSSSVASKIKPLKANGTVSMVVENEDLKGTLIYVVVLNDQGQLLAQKDTIIGGESDA